MGKPLLTDELLERLKRGEDLEDVDQFGHYRPDQAVSLDEEDLSAYLDEEDYQGYQEGQTIRIPVQPSVVKSRRIETIKREEFRGKINKILFWIIVLLILFVLAVLYL